MSQIDFEIQTILDNNTKVDYKNIVKELWNLSPDWNKKDKHMLNLYKLMVEWKEAAKISENEAYVYRICINGLIKAAGFKSLDYDDIE